MLRLVAGWLPAGFVAQDDPPDPDEVVAFVSFDTAGDAPSKERLGGIRCLRSEPVGVMFIHLFGSADEQADSSIEVERSESHGEGDERQAAVWGRCGEVELMAVATGVDEDDLVRVVEAIRVEPHVA